MRLFVAIDVPEGIKDAIEHDVVDPLRPVLEGARWTRPEGRHLTLAFLGEVADEHIAAISGALVSVKTRRFDAAFDEVGGFPNLRRPRVLWAGIGAGKDVMVTLAGKVASALERLGFEPEDRPFHPHFTLARFPKPSLIGPLPAVKVPDDPFTVGEMLLFRSQLHPKGARYTALERFALE